MNLIETSRRQRIRWTIAVIGSLALYVQAVWCEAAYEPGHIQFGEVLTWGRMLDALSVTTWSDIRLLEPIWLGTLELTTLLGMAGALLWLALRPVPEGTVARLVVWGYGVLLLSLGGWIALFMLLITPLQFPLDGEFLDEGGARLTAIGIWFVFCLRACWQLRPRLELESSPHRAVRALPPDPLR